MTLKLDPKIPDYNQGEGIEKGSKVTVWAHVHGSSYASRPPMEPVNVTHVIGKGRAYFTTEEKKKYHISYGSQYSGKFEYSGECLRLYRPGDEELIEISKLRVDICRLAKYMELVLSFPLAVESLSLTKNKNVPTYLVKSREALIEMAMIISKIDVDKVLNKQYFPRLRAQEGSWLSK
jgi:hypothetical protein